MSTLKVTLEIDEDSGELVSVFGPTGGSAVYPNPHQRKWNMHDIIITVQDKGPQSRSGDCPDGYYKITINNQPCCIPLT